MDGWSTPFDPRGWACVIGSLALSALVTSLGIRYAHRRKLIDQPGQRRSHTQPTPRGGGIGIVAAALAMLVAEMFLLPREATFDLIACTVSVTLVAAVGWIDDHGGLAARWRFLAHCVAALIVLVATFGGIVSVSSEAAKFAAIVLSVILGLGLVWSINLHNFMDGIDGLLAWQALFVFVVLALLAVVAGSPADAWHLAALAAAVAAFIPFNFPRARVFMGDVGSGTLGLLIGVAVLRQMSFGAAALLGGVAACSAFAVDATCNLVSRIWRGKRWYSAHREHLYQWLVRTGMTHARVVGLYLAWNLVLAAPVIWLVQHASGASAAVGWTVLLYVFGVVVWILAKRWCLKTVKAKRHAAA